MQQEDRCTVTTRAGNPCRNPRVPGLDVCTLHNPNRERGERCTALLKDRSSRCQNPPVAGSNVCRMHGAGTHKRVREGTRKDPNTANLKHGLRAKKLRGKIAERAKAYEERDAAELFNLKKQAASLHAALELADENGDLDAFAKIMAQLLRVTTQHHRLQKQGERMVPESEVIALISSLLTWTHELVVNSTIPREEIHKRLSGRLMEFARKLGGGTP